MRGRFAEGRSLIEQELSTARQLGLVLDIGAGFLRSAGSVSFMAGDIAEAERKLREGVVTLEQIGDTAHRVSVAADLALVLLAAQGREREVVELAEQHTPLMIEDDVDAVVRWDAARGLALGRLGRLDEAERLVRRAVDRAWATEYVDLRGLSQAALAEVLLRAGRRDGAAVALRQAVSVYEAKGNVVWATAARQTLERLEAGARSALA
jgi:tetratricopeptide (TPR) repeat protein